MLLPYPAQHHRNPLLLAVLLVDALGTGRFAPFSFLYFHGRVEEVAGRAAGDVRGLRVRGLGRRRGVARGAGLTFSELEAGHWPVASVPNELVELLAEIASERVRP
jgi:hypothetical protein